MGTLITALHHDAGRTTAKSSIDESNDWLRDDDVPF
jgi:hypothetical protein